ncbi:MAG: hypothetical protein KBH75_07395, partial [Saprospiraceae bacterium]|nr:hypothetical protein [Saprospiraceae bacterium]
FASIAFDFPAGPSMAVMATVFYGLIVAFAPEKGLLAKYLQGRRLKKRILIEDILKRTLQLGEGAGADPRTFADLSGTSLGALKQCFDRLLRLGLYEQRGQLFHLTSLGHTRALQLVRAHRLWETFLVEELGLSADQIHEDAERIEHYLSEEDLYKLDEQLGFPEKDPHGSPIPKA